MLSQILCRGVRTVFTDEQFQRLEQLGPRHKLIELAEAKAAEMMENDEELKKTYEGAMKKLTGKKTTKKTRQKAKMKLAKEEEPEMKSGEVSSQASWEQDCAQGRAYFLSKDYPR